MPRRRVVAKREILPDPVYHSALIAKFINCVMQSGKKSVAEKIVYGALDQISARSGKISAVMNAGKSKDYGDEEDDDGRTGGGAGGRGSLNVTKVFDAALEKIRPQLEVRSRRVGGATYQIPCEVPAVRRTTLAMRWLIEAASGRSEKTMALRIAGEIVDALEGRGSAVKKREDAHRMAIANQAFAHFRWN